MVSEPLVNVIGAGIAGMSAAIRLAEAGYRCNLVSLQASERAQSVLAEGGINAALDTMGEGDEVKNHIEDTLKGGCYLASERAVENLCRNAPDTVRRLQALGVPFNTVGGKIQLRNFGGQKKKRTAFSKTATGKMICSALIDEVRKYEARGLIERYSHHELYSLRLSEGACVGCVVVDVYASSVLTLDGPVILALGGLNGFFEGETTGTVQNTGDAAARLFGQGLPFADLEFIQYHPTTARITGKRMLISEAARGEGGRLFFYKDGHKYYYMEEKYPVLKNLMPRDVVSRETYAVLSSGNKAYLDMTEIKDDVWATKLSDLREEIRSYLHLDPKKVPVEVSPGIHFFMGGVKVDSCHRTDIKYLYAAGECACIYHGANRLGGNSLLGAAFGGTLSANTALKEYASFAFSDPTKDALSPSDNETILRDMTVSPSFNRKLKEALLSGLGIVREKMTMQTALSAVESLRQTAATATERARADLAKAMLLSALFRKESRGAHYRTDYPDASEDYRKTTVSVLSRGEPEITFVSIDEDSAREKGDYIYD